MNLLKRLYSIYAFLLFTCFFALLLPFFFLIIPFKPLHRFTGLLNKIWAVGFFGLMGLYPKIIKEGNLNPGTSYIFCPNHFSYLDIPLMGFTPGDFIFVGKSSISKVPLFGYMYRKLHITVDRTRLKSKYDTFMRSCKAVDEERSLVIFPEGGMLTQSPPQMVRFKDGPFRTAIEKQIPIVPVSIPFNWIILPDDHRFLLGFKRPVLVFHEPIQTQGMSMDDLDKLKNTCFAVIDQRLKLECSNTKVPKHINEKEQALA